MEYTFKSTSQFLEDYGSPFSWKLNILKVKTIHLSPTPEDAHLFNQIVDDIFWSNESWDIIKQTKSGGISISLTSVLPPMWDIYEGDTSIILTLIHEKGCARVCFEGDFDTNKRRSPISGPQALRQFTDLCAKYNIDLNSYALPPEQSVLIKESIPRPLIKIADGAEPERIYENCHHIDFHSSYPGGLVNTHPEFKEPVEYLYNRRKTCPNKKAVLNLTIGMMQSLKWNKKAQHAQLAFDAITDNNHRVEDVAKRLTDSGRVPLLYNTDGIWYQGEAYHGDGEGPGLGQWDNDHTNCTLRIKSAGAYEYIENGNYYPVVRGYTNLDKIKPREEWEWGDIFKDEASPYIFCFNGTFLCNEKGLLY